MRNTNNMKEKTLEEVEKDLQKILKESIDDGDWVNISRIQLLLAKMMICSLKAEKDRLNK